LLPWESPTGPSGSGVTWPRTTIMCSGCPRALWGWGGMLACFWWLMMIYDVYFGGS
jgi:hypothetical protein